MVGSSKRLCHWGIKLYRLTQSKFHEIFHQVHSKPIKIDQEFCLLKYETTLIMYISLNVISAKVKKNKYSDQPNHFQEFF